VPCPASLEAAASSEAGQGTKKQELLLYLIIKIYNLTTIFHSANNVHKTVQAKKIAQQSSC